MLCVEVGLHGSHLNFLFLLRFFLGTGELLGFSSLGLPPAPSCLSSESLLDEELELELEEPLDSDPSSPEDSESSGGPSDCKSLVLSEPVSEPVSPPFSVEAVTHGTFTLSLHITFQPEGVVMTAFLPDFQEKLNPS